MATLTKQHISSNGIISVEKWDKTMKNCSYNWLVEFSVNGHTTKKSKTFELESEADDYYNTLVLVDYIEIL